MTRLTVLAALLSAAPLFGQTKEVVEEVNALLEQQRIALRHADERNEDIEVLRRLLNKGFGFDHKTSQLAEAVQPYISTGSSFLGGGGMPPTTGFPNDIGKGGGWPGGQPGGVTGFAPQPGRTGVLNLPAGKRVSQAVGPFDGVYLKGAGVVFTLRVPREETQFGHGLCVGDVHTHLGLGSTCNGCHTEAKAAHKGVDAVALNDCQKCHDGGSPARNMAKPVSDWDRIRADVRGEKLPEVKAPVADPKKPRAVMCKPGDIRELLAAELFAHAKNVRNLDKNDWVTVVVTFDELPGANAGAPSGASKPTSQSGFFAEEVQALTLGDLHMKQGKYKEAAEAYEKGLARYREPVARVTFAASTPAEQVKQGIADLERSIRNTYKSLATAYLHLNEIEKAQTAVALAAVLKVEVAAPGGEKPKPQVPAKIHLAVAKSDIDRVKTLDEFRKSLHLELIGFPDAPPKK